MSILDPKKQMNIYPQVYTNGIICSVAFVKPDEYNSPVDAYQLFTTSMFHAATKADAKVPRVPFSVPYELPGCVRLSDGSTRGTEIVRL